MGGGARARAGGSLIEKWKQLSLRGASRQLSLLQQQEDEEMGEEELLEVAREEEEEKKGGKEEEEEVENVEYGQGSSYGYLDAVARYSAQVCVYMCVYVCA